MISDEGRLSAAIRGKLVDPDTELYLSIAAVWEIAIKHAAGKLRYSGSPSVQVPAHIRRSGVVPLPISVDHALASASLPQHHRDPFDRMMIAQARAEEMTLATADERLKQYDVPIVFAAS
jgi:PIN domain nuclease of toxin-antitoxin system